MQCLSVVLIVGGASLLIDGARIRTKAVVAQVLLRTAWARTDTQGQRQRPWPWADTWPVARLRVDRLGVDQVVLAEAGGESLAFGPSHVAGSAAPGSAGITVVAGHRDTHFQWLRRLRVGDVVVLETPDGRSHRYRAAETASAPARDMELRVAGADGALVLVTCRAPGVAEPDAMPRYLVAAYPIESAA